MTNDKMNKKYDLEERTAKFGEAIIKFAKKIPVNSVTQRIIPQLVAAGTSVGSNYCFNSYTTRTRLEKGPSKSVEKSYKEV